MRLFLPFLALASLIPLTCPGQAAGRPNVLWITVEDMSPTLGCYGDTLAKTPHIDALAAESILYENAFAVAPVCSPSRSCLITGLYPVSQGTHEMRSAIPLPSTVRGFPAYLRDAGYFTTNNVKTDYNTADEARLIAESWDESSPTAHWSHPAREAGQPFFAVVNDMTTHQSRTMVWPYPAFQEHVQSRLSPEQIQDPATVTLPPYYPDTPVVRQTMARYYDCVAVMDQNVGNLLAELEADGLAEDTIVFFFSDHGSGLPRHKRLLFDSGMRVPLLVRFPEKFRHLAPSGPGTETDRLVSFVDFPPTVLSLLGLEIPDAMQGGAFLGPSATSPRDYVYGSRDRVDEVIECSRSLRDERWLYIRNYLPFLSYNQPSVFSDLGEIRQEITRLARPEHIASLSPAQRDYAGPAKPVEAFYDVLADPNQLHNLLDGELTEEQQSALLRFRRAYPEMRSELHDPACLPESLLWDWMRQEDAPIGDILAGRTAHRPDLDAAWDAADLVGRADAATFLELLDSPEPAVRFWAVIGLRHLGEAPLDALIPHLEDLDPAVRIETAHWLALQDPARDQAVASLIAELQNEDWWTALRACRAIELLGERATAALPTMRTLYDQTRNAEGDGNFYLAFSSGAWLEAMDQPTEPWNFAP